MSRYRVSMDIGDTFTDVAAYDGETGTCAAGKPSTTPHDLTEGVLAGLHQVIGSAGETGFTIHGPAAGPQRVPPTSRRPRSAPRHARRRLHLSRPNLPARKRPDLAVSA